MSPFPSRVVVAGWMTAWVLALSAATRAGDPPPRKPDDSAAKGLFFYPSGPGAGRIRVIAGASLDVLPRRLVESEQRHVPHLTGGLRWGLPFGFSIEGRASAIVVSNELQAGLSWSYGTPDVAFALHARSGMWFGTIGVEGFDTTGTGVLTTPGLSIGLPLRNARITLGAEAILLQRQTITVGGSTLKRNRISFEGIALPLVVESMLPNGGAFYYGVTLIWARPDYQLWLAFSDSGARQVYPRLLAGYEF